MGCSYIQESPESLSKMMFEDWIIFIVIIWNTDHTYCVSTDTWKKLWGLKPEILNTNKYQNKKPEPRLQGFTPRITGTPILPYHKDIDFVDCRILYSFMSIWDLLYHPSKLCPYQHSQTTLSYNFHINILLSMQCLLLLDKSICQISNVIFFNSFSVL